MKEPFRLPRGGHAINLAKPVRFTFDGKAYQGCEGDTLASALLANGVRLVGRSFKYHRPRGLITHGSHEPNALMELREGARREPNTRATMVELFDGLEASSQNRYPSLQFDLLSANRFLAPFLGAGFYYKTFMWPQKFWEPVYEKFIRRSAGLGRASIKPDPDTYEHAHAHHDVLVVGGGPAGLSAALSAARTGARVALCEETAHWGGMLCGTLDAVNGKPAFQWMEEAVATLADMTNVTLMPRTCVFGYYDGNVFGALERVSDHLAKPQDGQPRQRLWTIRAKQVVLACGAQERMLTFDDNDKPGVLLAGSIRHMAEHYGVSPGKRVVICTNNDDAYRTALVLQQAGVEIAMFADSRLGKSPYAEQLQLSGIRVENGVLPKKAHGRHAVSAITMQRSDGEFFEKVECDCVGVSGGWSADVHLASQTGAAPVWQEEILSFVPANSNRAERSAGSGNGTFSLDRCLFEGHTAGIEAAKAAGQKVGRPSKAPVADPSPQLPPEGVWRCPGTGKAFVDFQNDVTASDIAQAAREGFVSVEHAKRYTTLGMATDQGKTSNVTGLALLAIARGEPIEKVGTTRFRPPYSPVAIGAFAGHERGREFKPLRRTAMHEVHEKLGATLVEAGLWLRPQVYPSPGEGIMQTIYRETRQVRESVGMCDVSTLGKIDLFGSDAAEFLNRLYINGWKTLPVGKARYGVMLREDGFVFDDGTTSRLAEDHFLMTTTTANAAGVLAHMEHASQVLWPELDVQFCSATEQWCGVSVAGPNARKVLQKAFGKSVDVSADKLPFMGVREFEWLGGVARVFRISFSGELAFEVNVPWGHGEAMWNAIWEAGKNFDLIPYGTEALSALRIEKGHVAGNELDGRTTAADLGLGKMMSTKKDFIGKTLSKRRAMIADDRPQLIGITRLEGASRLRGGAHLVLDAEDASAETSLGWVSSVCDSPAVGAWIGLGFAKGGLTAHDGKTLYAVSPLHEETVKVRVSSPHFFDPEGGRMHG